jgi:hypothetical protein
MSPGVDPDLDDADGPKRASQDQVAEADRQAAWSTPALRSVLLIAIVVPAASLGG